MFLVPIVYGAKDVHKTAPPYSYIDVRDFKSPKHLAEYLIYLDKNETAYMSYFDWKKDYDVVRQSCYYGSVLQHFCNYVFGGHKPKILKNFTNWFYDKSECESSDF